MDVKVTKADSNPKLEPHHIYLRNGQVISVMAYSFRVHFNKQTISFFNSETDRSKKIFWQLPEVTGIVASSVLAELPPLVKLQNQVEAVVARMDAFEINFATRMDALENNIGEIIARAVRAGINSKI
jgi:hypothetical protein